MIVATAYGKLSGAGANDIYSFKNIPYGDSTAGENRFKPPAKPQPWSGVREATAVGNIAPQMVGTTLPALASILGTVESLTQSEDCLNLNVYTPGINSQDKRPVMVWLHGGGLVGGSGNMPAYDGSNLARRGDVVVVTVSHRLGVLGFLHLGELLGAEYETSGNNGFLDLIAALEWVRDNIAEFGGDPGNVTIFGESGGGLKVSTLLGMPAAQGLFHKAIIQSGAQVQGVSREQAARYATQFLPHVELMPEDARRLLHMPADKLIDGQVKALRGRLMSSTLNFGPVIDGRVVPQSPFDPEASPLSDATPLLIGTTRHEMSLFLAADERITARTLTRAELTELAIKSARDEALGKRLVAAYSNAYPDASPALLLILIESDRGIILDTVKLAERRAARRTAPVYMYQLAWESPAMGGKLLACHALDVPLVFDNVTARGLASGKAAQALAATMSEAWATFARTGSPQAKALPEWPIYSAPERSTMIFDEDCRIENDPGGKARAAWTAEE